MARSGIITEREYDDKIALSLEWKANENPVDNTITFTFKVWFDNTKQFGLCHFKATTKNYVQVRNSVDGLTTKYFFDMPKITEKKRHLLATITTDPLTAGRYERDFACNLEAYCDIDGTVYASLLTSYFEYDMKVSGDITIDGVKRTSTMDIFGSYTLGVENEISVIRVHDILTHEISYECGTKTGLIYPKGTDEHITFSLPIELAEEDTKKLSLPVTFTIVTLYDKQEIARQTVKKTYAMPESVKPSCVIEVEDGERLTDKYGGYVQGQSRFVVEVTPTIAYKSPIDAYLINANGETLKTSTATTAVLQNSGSQEITAVVTDQRGRTSPEASVTIDVIPWKKPRVTDLQTARCDENGELNSNGEYLKATFDAEISPVNNKNSAKYVISYQQTSGIGSGIKEITNYSGQYSIKGGYYIFAADKNASYAVSVTAYDDFDEGTRSTGGATAVVLMNLLASGLGLCFGNIATLDGVCEIAFKTYPSGGFIHPKLTTIDETTPNTYYCKNPQDLELPSRVAAVLKDPFVMDVVSISDDGDVMQRITTCPSDVNEVPLVLVRSLQGAEVKPWFNVVSGEDYA